MDFNFVFIIPSYNNANWYGLNLQSILQQRNKNWRAIYINDASTDNTSNLVKKYIKENGFINKFTFIDNSDKGTPAKSRYIGYTQTDPKEICCFLDGDDWLYDNNVLDILSKYYSKGFNCTYGSYITLDNNNKKKTIFPKENYSDDVINNKSYRICNQWFARHLRTMQSKLIQDIDFERHLIFKGEWLKINTDQAEMFYVLEKSECVPVHIKKILYVYNMINSSKYPTSYYRPDMNKYRKEIHEYIKSL